MTARVRLAEIEQISICRALTSEESDELFHAHHVESCRQKRLPGRIMRLRAELRKYEAELWPCYLPALRALEQQEEHDRIARLEAELGPEVKP